MDSNFQVLPTRRHQSPRIKPKQGHLSGIIHPIEQYPISTLEIHAICALYEKSLVLFVKIPIVLGVDWAWYVKFYLFSKSCLFASLLHLWNICDTCKNGWKQSLLHILNGCALLCSPTGSCHGPWNSRVVSLVWPLLAFQSSTQRLAMDFLMLLSAFAKLHIPHMPKFCMPTFGNGRNNSKTACICLYRVRFAKFTSALFLVKTWGKTS